MEQSLLHSAYCWRVRYFLASVEVVPIRQSSIYLHAPLLIRCNQEPGVLERFLGLLMVWHAGLKGIAGTKQVVMVGWLQIFLSQSWEFAFLLLFRGSLLTPTFSSQHTAFSPFSLPVHVHSISSCSFLQLFQFFSCPAFFCSTSRLFCTANETVPLKPLKSWREQSPCLRYQGI